MSITTLNSTDSGATSRTVINDNFSYLDTNKATGTGTASGTNTGDETSTTIKTKLGITTLSGDNTGDQTLGSLGAEAVANKSTSVSTDCSSDTKYPSVKSVKDYADGLVAGLLDYRGAYNASGNTFPATGGSGTAGAVLKGDMWIISGAGSLGGSSVQIGDSIIANVDTPGQTAGNWNILNSNISYVPEDSANKENSTIDTSATKYPTVNLLKTGLDAKASLTGVETLTNKRITKRVTSTTDDSTAEINIDTTDVYVLTAVANATTFTLTGTPTNGQTLLIRFKDAGVAKGLTWTGFTAIGVTLPTTTVANKQHYVGCMYNGAATRWEAIAVSVEA